MKKNLVIVESGAKAKTISKYLNSIPELKSYGDWDVQASVGHLTELNKKDKNAIEVDNDFKLNYIISPDKQSVVDNLKKKIKSSDMIWLAADKDREGEAIAYNIKELFKLKKYKRIDFVEITKPALLEAVLHPRDIDMSLVQAQQSRVIIDRLTGYKLTGCLWKAFSSNNVISTGRVMGAGMLLIIMKENEINNFKSESYYKVSGDFMIDKIEVIDCDLYNSNNIIKLNTDKKAKELLKLLIDNSNKYVIKDINDKNVSEKPPLPFITSTLQQEASSKLHMSIKSVMSLAQKLYESGFITYMRTDSYNISDTAHKDIENYIVSMYSQDNYNRRIVSKKSKNSQEAHEAIRPTDITKDTVGLTKEHQKLYELIRLRTIASQMSDAIYRECSVKITNKVLSSDNYFLGRIKKLLNPGYLLVYNINVKKNELSELNQWLSDVKNSKNISMKELNARNIYTIPPARYSEATFIKKLESESIGRPSTFSSIISKLYDRNYIEKKDVYGEKKNYKHFNVKKNKIVEKEEISELYYEKSKLVPTDTGKSINKFLVNNFDEIINVNFTSEVEENLDKIALKNLDKQKFLKLFYKKLLTTLSNVKLQKTKEDIKRNYSADNKTYTINGKSYIVRNGKFGPLIETTIKNKKSFIGLKPYLNIVKKNLEDLTEADIKVVLQYPKIIGKKNNKEIELLMGKYGFYLKYDNNNYKIPFNIRSKILTMTNYNTLLEII